MIELPAKTYFKIGEVAKLLEVEPYVLRYWETEFDVLEPEKTKSGQRVYQREDIELLLQVRALLYEEMFTIAGARRQLERSREGKTSYFDLKAGQVEGTAVAGDEELMARLEEARLELVEVHQELEATRGALHEAETEVGELAAALQTAEAESAPLVETRVVDHGLVAQLQAEVGELQDRLKASEGERVRRRQRRAEVLDALESQVRTLARSQGGW